MTALLREIKIAARQVVQYRRWTAERRRLDALRDRHRGSRCFIVGNGPSIQSQDLARLAGEVTFVTNHFLQHPQIRSIDPTYYCASDPRIFLPRIDENWLQSYRHLPPETVSFLPMRVAETVGAIPDISAHETYFLNYIPRPIWETEKISLDVTRCVYSGDTIVIDFCLPLAHFMGIETVYLVGCDTNYGLNSAKDYSTGYFYDVSKTTTTRQTREYHLNQWYDNVVRSYEAVKSAFERSGRRILNATAGGDLEVFERVSYEEVVGGVPAMRGGVERVQVAENG